MGKTKKTLELERKLYARTRQDGYPYGAFEVTLWSNGNGGNGAAYERVDFLTVDRKGIWRAYEIKVSRADFYSSAAKSFIGNYNYYVMPESLYKEVKQDVPNHVGVLVEGSFPNSLISIKNAKKTNLGLPVEELYISLICSLNRVADKYHNNLDKDVVARYRNQANRLKRENRELRNSIMACMNCNYKPNKTHMRR